MADELAGRLVTQGIENHRVLAAFRRIDRRFFVPAGEQDKAYENYPIGIGNRVTISSPYIHAISIQESLPPMCQRRCEDNGETSECMRRSCGKVLEIGYGSGFQTALLAMIYDQVYAIEYIPEIAELGKTNVANFAKHLRSINKAHYAEKLERIHWRTGDGFGGWAEHAPFDAIIVSAGGSFVPEPLKQQLKERATLVGPFGSSGDQKLEKITRTSQSSFQTQELMRVRFVPFISEHFGNTSP
jgi:protein-L-isoaspartate(D-aspartate) O-methyltransferase